MTNSDDLLKRLDAAIPMLIALGGHGSWYADVAEDISQTSAAIVNQAARIRELEAELAEMRGQVKYGCHVELFDDQKPDDCVHDYGAVDDCIYARKYDSKWKCPYWRPIAAAKEGDNG